MIALIGTLAEAHRVALADRTERDPSLASILDTAATLATRGSTIIVATGLDQPGSDFDASVLRITRRHDLIFLLVEDAFEREPPPGDYPFFTVDGISGWLRIDPGHKRREDKARRVAALRRLGAQATVVSTETSAEHSVQTLEMIDG
jgi:uncharacterized protein (DUF58 family)